MYSRAASFAARTAQALITATPRVFGALQVYVDDHVVVAVEDDEDVTQAVGLVPLWWSMFGRVRQGSGDM